MRPMPIAILVLLCNQAAPAQAATATLNHGTARASPPGAQGQGPPATQPHSRAPATTPTPSAGPLPSASRIEAGARELLAFAILEVELVGGDRVALSASDRAAWARLLVRLAASPARKRGLAIWTAVGPEHARVLAQAVTQEQRLLHARQGAHLLVALDLLPPMPSCKRPVEECLLAKVQRAAAASPTPTRPRWNDVPGWRRAVPDLLPIEVADLMTTVEFRRLLADPTIAAAARSKLDEDLDHLTRMSEAMRMAADSLRTLLRGDAKGRGVRFRIGDGV